MGYNEALVDYINFSHFFCSLKRKYKKEIDVKNSLIVFPTNISDGFIMEQKTE